MATRPILPSTHNQLASEPQTGPIWCMPFKRPQGRELPDWQREINRGFVRLQAVGEFPFRILKQQFRFTKVRYRGLFKNGQALTIKFALGNLYTVRRTLFAAAG